LFDDQVFFRAETPPGNIRQTERTHANLQASRRLDTSPLRQG